MVQHFRRHCIGWRLILAALFAALGMSLGEFQPVYAQTPVNCADEAITGVPQAECETLVALYTGTFGPYSAGWHNDTNWNTATAVSSWYGVTVSGGHVTELLLVENGLNGDIPGLSALTQLHTLDLSHNILWGGIPNLSALTQLQILDLGYNGFSGSIPDLSALTQLHTLNLHNHGGPEGESYLSGSIPDLSALTQLQTLVLSNNQLSGSISSLAGLTQLQTLDLSYNRLSGSIPDLSRLTQLQVLDLSINQLSGGIPSLAGLTQLQTLDLSTNPLGGGIPSLAGLTQLQTLGLRYNQLSGTIPSLTGLAQLQTFSLSGNQLSGSIPDLSGLTSLQELTIEHNQLSGSIPSLSALTQLHELALDNNQLVTLIPPSITGTAITALQLCGGGNIIASPDSLVVAWVSARDTSWTQGCGLGTAPTATTDPTYTASANITLTISAPGVLANDTVGVPAVGLSSFGGGSLGGAVTNHAAGSTVNPLPGYSNGSLRVNADGSFVFTPPTDFSGAYTFQYRLNNGVGLSDATVTIAVSHFCAQTALTGVPQAECETLVAFYNSTNGPGWTTKTNWNTLTNVETWYGVDLTDGHVRKLDLSGNNLSGSIPSLSALTELRTIWLGGNNMSGHIPDLSALTQLYDLFLDRNRLSGSIPSLTGLTQLRRLDLSNNQLSGRIPDLTGLTQLQLLFLEYNQLSGSIPDLSGLTQLDALRLRYNQLVSLIPPSITYTSISPQDNLRLCGGYNIIASPDPTVIAWLPGRDWFWTQGCDRGTAPRATADPGYTTPANTTLTVNTPGVLANDATGKPAGIVTFFGDGSLGGVVADHATGTTVSPLPGYSDGSLVVNADGSFVFTPPTDFSGAYTFQYRLNNGVGLSDATVTIAVSHFCAQTAITGVPQAECEALIALYTSTNGSGWTNKTNWNTATEVDRWYGVSVVDGHVTELSLNYNYLTESVPSLSGLTQLQTLSLRDNHLTGSIPDLSGLTQLQRLDLSDNILSGSIPDLSALTQLQTLDLSDNELSGNIPDLSALTQLQTLNLEGNFDVLAGSGLSGRIPDLSVFTHLQYLDLSDNQLSGNIPDLSALTHLQYLHLFYNELSGRIPDLSGLTQLHTLDLTYNQLSGTIPDLSALTQLVELYLSHNQLSGRIPDLSALTQLQTLDLTYNQLSGTIPDLSALTQLQTFWLYGNQLVSLIPSSITETSINTWHLVLCGGGNIISSPDPTVITWVQMRDDAWTQGCGLGTAPTATADSDYTTGENTTLTITAPGVLENDTLGTPEAMVTFFGGGSLGDLVTDHAAGTTISPLPGYSDGSLVVNADGSFVFTPPLDFTGPFTFDYRASNGVGASDAAVSIQVMLGFSVNDVSGFESNTATITFTVTLTSTTDLTTTVDYVTADETATADSDYTATNGTLTFDPGVTTQSIVVPLRGDAAVEGNETFVVNLSNPTNASISDAQGQGTITNSTVKPTKPAADSLLNDDTPTFVWAAITGAAQYRLQVDNNADFSSPTFTVKLTTIRYVSSQLSDARYYWRVQARDEAGHWGMWSPKIAFTIDSTPPAAPGLLSPANNATIADSTPRFRWNAVSGAALYRLQLDNNIDFSSPIINETLTGTAYTQPSALGDRTYYWRVRAQDEAGNWSAWSTRWSFTVNAVPLAAPTLIPTNTSRPTHTPTTTLSVTPTETATAAPTATMTEIMPLRQVIESDQPIVLQTGGWIAYHEPSASGGAYLLSSTPQDMLSLAFAGSEVTVVYIQHPAVGSFAVEIDGVLIQTIDSVAAETIFGTEATVSGLVYGQHTIRVYPVSGVVAIDAFKVEMALQVVVPTETPVPTDILTDVPTDVPTNVPTDIPTETPVPTDVPTETPIPTDVPTKTPVPTEAPTLTPVPTDVPTGDPAEVVPPAESTEEPVS